MANGVKVYSIKINGIESSIKDVNKLSESLEISTLLLPKVVLAAAVACPVK